MRIQELERKTGLERASIRFYEKEGLLNPKRLENGYRDYSEEDAELLKKIKLLRRLGMSIEKIHQLQQGNADLTAAIAQLASYHTSQIDDHRRCRAVCEAIRDDGAVFVSLDAEHYLRLLREIRIDDRVLGRSDFQEPVPAEIHPWRRYFARCLDYLWWGAIVQFIWIVVLRIRPIPGDFGNSLLTIASAAAFVPVEAMLLCKFGTTPGKYVTGIRLEYIQGGNLPFSEALYRSLQVFVSGVGLAIPVVELLLGTYRYCQLTGRSWRRFARHDEINPPEDMPWDEQTEFVYSNHNWKRGVAVAAILAAFLGLTVASVADGMKPKYRGNQLTVAQVAENYNVTLAVLRENVQSYDKLQEDGTKAPVPSNTVIFDLNSSENDQIQFFYDAQDGIVYAVEIHHHWDSVFYLQPLQGDALQMAYSLLLAQEGCGWKELSEFIKLYESHLDQKQVSFTYRNLLVEWNIDTEKPMLQGIIYADGEENVSATLDFRVAIQ